LRSELLLIFLVFPAVISIAKPRGLTMVIIWTVAALCWRVLRSCDYSWKTEWNAAALTPDNLAPIVRRFIPNAIATTLFAWFMVPQHLFQMPLERPHLWVLIMILYPLLSVVPQEIIFRSFFLKRYEHTIPAHYMQTVNALAFGWVHIIMQNWIAVFFSAIGGWLFTGSYRKHKSLAVASLEHALYGCYIFTVGLGMFFYHGNVK